MKRIALLAVIGVWAVLYTGCSDSGTNVAGVHDTLSIFVHDTMRIYSYDTIHTSSHDTVLIITHDSIMTYDTVTIYTYDTVRIYYGDTTTMKWTVGTSIPTDSNSNVFCLIRGGNLFVAVGGCFDSSLHGIVFTSPDGVTWTRNLLMTVPVALHDVVWANNTYVAVGNAGTIVTSPDGITWTAQTSGTSTDLYGVAYGASTFMAYSVYDSVVYTSSDGLSWTIDTANIMFYEEDIAYGNNRFVMTADFIYTSTDGLAWTSTGIPTWRGDTHVLWADSQFVIGGRDNIMTSPDGLVWTNRAPWIGITDFIAWGNGKFVVVTDPAAGPALIYTSLEGITWNLEASFLPMGYDYIAYGAGKFIVANNYGAVLTSDW
jgi:hypothetical protein